MKKKINIIINILKSTFENYPVVYSTSIIYSIIFCILYENNSDILSKITIPFLILFGSTFLVETIIKNKSKKYFGYIICFIVSIIFAVLSFNKIIFENSIFNRIVAYILLSTILIGIYYNYTKTKKSFSKYLANVFSNVFKVAIINSILMVGLVLITIIFDYLILNGTSDLLILKIIVLETGFYLVPALVYSTKKYDKVSSFIHILINRVLFILILIAYLIIYLYIFKIIITWTMPSNVVFRILSVLFIFSSLITLMVKDSEENVKLKRINDLLPYLFIPFILLQIYSLGVRISAYGLTSIRYFGLALLIIEIIYTIFIIKKIDMGKLLFVLVVEIFLILLVPYLNYDELPLKMQYKILIKYKDSNQAKAKSAYDYLVTTDHDELIDKVLTVEEKNKFDSQYSNEFNTKYIDGMLDINSLNVGDYNKIYMINDSNMNKNYVININNINYDLMPYLKKCISNSKNFQQYFEENHVINTSDNIKIVFSEMHITFNGTVIEYMYFSGYILEK